MVDVVIDEIDPPVLGPDWKSTVRRRILSARRALLRHPWASGVIESRASPTPAVLAYVDSVVGSGCDDQFEFEFALDLLLDGFERLQQQAVGP
jgi:hypothetical protein